MFDEESWNRIARYALGECSAEEAVETRLWIEADAERVALARELAQLANSGPTSVWNARAAWLRFHGSVIDEAPLEQLATRAEANVRIAERRPPHERRPTFRRPAPTRRGWLAAAAVATLVAGSALAWQAMRGEGPLLVANEELRSLRTQRGQTAELYLSDGTHVVLGAESELRFHAQLRGPREVHLEGEAYFDVADVRKLPWTRKRPFTVHTPNARVRDIGTRFSVRAHRDSPGTEVAVAEGAVALAAATSPGQGRAVADSLVLTQGDLGRLDDTGALSVHRGLDLDAYLGWMTGQLAFLDTPASEVVAQFRRWYDLDLQLADSALARARVTGTFDTAAPAQALELLAIMLDARLEKKADIVVFRRHSRGY